LKKRGKEWGDGGSRNKKGERDREKGAFRSRNEKEGEGDRTGSGKIGEMRE